MTSEPMSDQEVVRTISDEILALFSARQRAALDNILARMEAAEKVCGLVGTSLSPKRRAAEKGQGKNVYWWDVAAAVKEWEKIAGRAGATEGMGHAESE